MGIGGILIIVSKEANRITMPITELLVMLYAAAAIRKYTKALPAASAEKLNRAFNSLRS